MAEVQNPITGRSKNKFANAIFSTWKGKNILRSKPLSVGNPRTTAQVKQRLRIGFLAKKSSELGSLLRDSFKEVANGMTEFNAFVKRNYQNTDASGSTPSFVSAEDVIVSAGSLAGLADPSVTIMSSQSIKLEWSSQSASANCLGTDTVVLVGFDTVTKRMSVSANNTARSDYDFNFSFPNGLNSGSTVFYAVVLRQSEGKASNSQTLV